MGNGAGVPILQTPTHPQRMSRLFPSLGHPQCVTLYAFPPAAMAPFKKRSLAGVTMPDAKVDCSVGAASAPRFLMVLAFTSICGANAFSSGENAYGTGFPSGPLATRTEVTEPRA